MPMSEELFIPQGHPIDVARSWRRIWEDSELNVIAAFSLIVVLAALYIATHYPLSQEIYTALITTT
jgi:hypothetical protein